MPDHAFKIGRAILALAGAAQTARHVDDQLGQPPGPGRLGEERPGIPVIDGPPPGQDFAQVGEED